MADPKKISQLTTAGPLTGVELLPIVQNSGTLQTTVSAVAIFATSTLSSNVAAVSSRLDTVSAATSANAANIATVSAVAFANAAAITSINNTVNTLSGRVDAVSAAVVSTNAVVSALSSAVVQVQASISAINSALAAIDVSALVALESRVSTLEIRVANVSASVSALQVQVNDVSAATSVKAAAITSVNNVVSALEIRVSAASATGVTNAAAITSINNVVSALEIRVSNASAAIVSLGSALTSTNNIVSALEVRVSAVSATGATNAAAITSINNAVSALEIRVSAASATGAANSAAITSINNVVSALDVRLTAVSASVSALQVQVNAVSVLTSINTAAITSVNAVVSLKAFRNGDFLTNVQYIDFNTTTSYAPQPGRLTWDIESGTLDLGLTGTVNLLIGQRTVAQLYNNSGVTLPKGNAVRVTGAQGQRLTGAHAQADSDADSMTIFGIMLETVSVNNSGYVATDGLVRNVNTIGYSDGDIVYLSPVSAGELTPIKPVAPQHLVQMGYIVNGGSGGAGEIYVKVQNGYELGELHDVKVSSSLSISDGEVLAYNVSAKVWTNSTALINAQASISALNIQLAAVSALTSANAAAITSLNNVVSALEIRVSTVSAAVSVNTVAINAVSAATSLRVLRAGDRMTGQLAVAVSADQIGVSVVGGLVVTSTVNFTGSSGLLVHSGTTATRPGSPTPGIIRFNSGSNTFEGYTSATWGAIGGGGGATGGGSNQAFYLNDTVVSVSYSIPSGKNAGTFGPVTIATGVTVEVPSGSTWTVV